MAPRGKLCQWNQSNMKQAIEAVRGGEMGILLASKTFGVPHTTLQRKARSDEPIDVVVSAKLGRKAIFSKEMEEQLVKYLLEMESRYWGLTSSDIRSLAFQLAEKNKIPHRFSLLTQSAGKDWLKRFCNRHSNTIRFRSPSGTSFDRAKGFTKSNIDIFFNILEQVCEKTHFSQNNIYNVDETGLTVVQSHHSKVIAAKGKRQIGAMTSAERGSLITVISCMSAGGSFVPPFFIFPRKKNNVLFMKDAPPGAKSACHISGWVQVPIFTEWFKHFLHFTKPTKEEPVLLILDGHYSHTRNLDVLELARQNGVSIISLPPHSTHKLQPLDRTFMGPLKKYYNDEIRRFTRESCRKATIYDLVGIFAKAYFKTAKPETAINGFKCTGIYPFNRDIFSEADFIAGEIGPDKENLNHVTADDVTDPNCYSTEIMPLAQITQQIPESNSHAFNITPWDISPIPKAKKQQTNRRGRRTVSTLLTTSPYKQSLELSIQNIQEQKTKKDKPVKKAMQKLPKTKNRVDSSSESDMSIAYASSEDRCDDFPPPQTQCSICKKMWQEDKEVSEWVQCLQCDLIWVHMKCLPKRSPIFLCDSCATN